MKTLLSEKMMANGGALDTTPVRFDYTGAVQEYLIPKGVKKLAVDCVGGAGGALGGRVECIINVKSIQKLYLVIAQASADGYNASDIRTTAEDLYSRLVVAGGGGNKGNGSTRSASGGNGGGITGATGGAAKDTATGGGGGTQTAGGGGAYGGSVNGAAGQFGIGGTGGAKALSGSYAYGGHGGSGWYGGGGGGIRCAKAISSYDGSAGGGGGGSSYTNPELCMDVVHTQGYSEAAGNGWIILTPIK